jgi:hypothetical protein
VSAFALNEQLQGETEWPSRIFALSTIEAVVVLSRKQDSGSTSLNARIVSSTFEYIVIAHGVHRNRVLQSIGSNVSHVLEVCCQMLIAGDRKQDLIGDDLESLSGSGIRALVNDLIEQGGDRVYTPLALMALEM